MNKRSVCRLFDNAGFGYYDQGSCIVLEFIYTGDSDIIERGTVVNPVVLWNENFVTIQLPLIESAENEEIFMDPFLMEKLRRANNFDLEMCHFEFDSGYLSVIADLDARNLQPDEINLAIDWLLYGFEKYVGIIIEWFSYLIENNSFMPIEYYEDYENDEYREELYEWINSRDSKNDSKKDLILEALTGICKLGATAAICSAVGIPAAGIVTVLAAVGGIALGSKK
jgi:hypothetical protein